jgi:serine/threonine protein kinase
LLVTSNYIAPEQAGGRPVDAHTDIYSLGVVLHELLTGEVPFPGDNFVAVAMKHINEPPPDLLEKRPDLPLRVAAIVDRALQKDPGDRFPSMHDFAAELDAALHELGSPDSDRTAIFPSPVIRASRPRPMRSRSRWPLLLSALALVAAAAVVAGVLALGGSKPTKGKGGGGAAAANVHLSAVSDFDPYGDDHQEHPGDVPKATDGDTSTAWTTSSYYSGLAKPGVGIIVDAGKPLALRTITVSTDTPGYRAQIRTASSSTGPLGAVDSATKPVAGSTTFSLNGATSRYYIVWIVDLGGLRQAHINEVKAG